MTVQLVIEDASGASTCTDIATIRSPCQGPNHRPPTLHFFAITVRASRLMISMPRGITSSACALRPPHWRIPPQYGVINLAK
jgi:hypothetical protein